MSRFAGESPRADSVDKYERSASLELVGRKGRLMEGARRGKALVIALVAGGTLLALAATAYILATWGR